MGLKDWLAKNNVSQQSVSQILRDEEAKIGKRGRKTDSRRKKTATDVLKEEGYIDNNNNLTKAGEGWVRTQGGTVAGGFATTTDSAGNNIGGIIDNDRELQGDGQLLVSTTGGTAGRPGGGGQIPAQPTEVKNTTPPVSPPPRPSSVSFPSSADAQKAVDEFTKDYKDAVKKINEGPRETNVVIDPDDIFAILNKDITMVQNVRQNTQGQLNLYGRLQYEFDRPNTNQVYSTALGRCRNRRADGSGFYSDD